MRLLVDLPESDLAHLNDLSRARNTSRAQLIRTAVSEFLAQNKASLHESFGLWKDRAEDGLSYERRLRSEWER